MVNTEFKNKVAEMRNVMHGFINDMVDNGAGDDEILAIIKLMREESVKLEDDHIDLMFEMGGEEHTSEMVMSSVELVGMMDQ